MAFVCKLRVDLATTRKKLQNNAKNYPFFQPARKMSNIKKPNFTFPEENVANRMSELDYDVFFRKMFQAVDLPFESISASTTEQIIRNRHNFNISEHELRQRTFTKFITDTYLQSLEVLDHFIGKIVQFHDWSGLNYWMIFFLLGSCTKLLLFPKVMKVHKHNINLSHVEPELHRLFEEFRQANKRGQYTEGEGYKKQLLDLMKSRQLHSMVSIRCWWDLPMILLSILTVRHMATAHPALLAHGGTLWFEDLSQMDFFARFNILAAIGTLTSFEIGAEVGPHVRRKGLARAMVYTSTLVFFVYLYVSPMASHLVWCAAAWSSVGIGLTLRTPQVKRIFKIPQPMFRDYWSHNPKDLTDQKK